MTDNIIIRSLRIADVSAALALLPDLADFDVPARRNPKHLWESDAELLAGVAKGEAPNSYANVAVDANDNLVGLTLITLRQELLSHAPSAHLEAIVVSKKARGLGLGRRLLAHAESSAAALGAESLSLHVFSNNHRARGLYNSQGYDSELIRAIKWLDTTPDGKD